MYCNGCNRYLFLNGKETKLDNKNVDFPTQCYLRSISKKLDTNESTEGSFKVNVCDFSVDYSDIDKSDILIIHMYLKVKNNIKQCSGLFKTSLLRY